MSALLYFFHLSPRRVSPAAAYLLCLRHSSKFLGADVFMEAQQENGRVKTRTRRKRYVYSFGGGNADGNAGMNWLLGGKGANLAEMAGLGLPVPPGMTITTEVCTYYYDHERTYPAELSQQVQKGLKKIERIMGRRFGDASNPLLLSVRSGARVSMPGMMDTVLNLGLNDETVQGLIRQSGNPRFAYDCYRRFVQMYGDVVLGLKPESKTERDPFENLIEEKKAARGIELDTQFTVDDLRDLVTAFNPRAVTYRKIEHIPEEWGTAVTVQAMVFGNLGEDCATGVAFTRDLSTGEKGLNGDFLVNAQGEDVVAGIRTPQQITLAAARERAAREGRSEEEPPYKRSRTNSKRITKTRKILSSPSKAGSCGCCRRVLVNARPQQR
jgi:pyruvate,orthophosphate dikinase